MEINPVTNTRLVHLRQSLVQAPHGQRSAMKQAACAELGVSLATLHRQLDKATMTNQPRKTRSDAGKVTLCREEAALISAMLMSSHRKTGKRLMSIGQAVEILRANKEVRAEALDEASGELRPLSDSAIARALRSYNLHPDQLNRAAPSVELKSMHPNHVWQIDASLCVLYYLNARTASESGLQVMERDKFYKNKPANLKRIEADRVWSYETTDHNSGAIALNYVMGAESGTNLADSFLAAIQKRDGDPMHGVPFILMMDMGSANTSGLFANLARRLQVKLIAHAPGNARATGQVENARNLIETSFESGLRLRPVADLAELNAQAQRWARWFNANRIHSRHGKTRYDQWLTIKPEQLRIAPPLTLCRELLNHTPESRKVSSTMTVSFKGREYDVSAVPNAMQGERLLVAINPYAADAATVVETAADGSEHLRTVPMVVRNADGFREDGNTIGEEWGRRADTQIDTNRKEVERLIYGADTDEQAEAARKAKATPFGGRIDPGKVIDMAPERNYLPKQGAATVLGTTTASTPAAVRELNHFEACRALVGLGVAMSPELLATLKSLHPDTVPEDQLPALKDRLTVRAGLRVVNGGAL
jgi:hypothetical protein